MSTSNESKDIAKKVFTEKKDFPLSTIRDMVDDGDIIPQPDYQRDYVYSVKDASRLIESVLMGIPIPTIYLCEELDGTFSIIDGQQRVTSFVQFLKNDFALKGLEELTEFNGKKFRDLEKNYQRNLKSVTLNTIVLKKESQELKYEIFARLNRGAVKLKPQELRNCVYRGSFNDMLEKIAKDNKHLKELFIEENKRKNYQEYILRFFALRNYTEYSSSIGKTMNNFMAKHQNDDEKQIEESKKLFNGTIDIIKQIFGKTAFSAYDRQNCYFMNKFSGSVYDSIAIACSMFSSNDLMRCADEIRDTITDIKKNNPEYSDFTYAATGSKERVVGRIMLIYEAIRKITEKNSNSAVRAFPIQDRMALWHEGYVCSYCGQKILDVADAEVDHIIPFSQGGETVIENAQLLHRHCNRAKYNHSDIESVNFEDEEN